jgi:ATP phosphoribosyltransferase
LLTKCQQDNIKLALPKGRLLPATACLLKEIELEFDNYSERTRFYRLQSTRLPNLSAKIFQEKDIPIQVAIGNYDLGICGLDWIEELTAKYPTSALLKVTDLEYSKGNLYLAASRYGNISSLQELPAAGQYSWRIVTEYPNLAEASALNLRLRRFRVFPVWGAAEVYPPENADLVLLWAKDESEITAQNLVPLKTLLSTNAFLIANQESWQTKNVSQVIAYFSRGLEMKAKPWLKIKPEPSKSYNSFKPDFNEEKVWLALPDGHQQEPTAEFLNKIGLELDGYSGDMLSRRPRFNLDGVNAKVIRPQDMPLQVANGNFDLAITGKDWLLDHLYRFPSSPVTQLTELGFGQVKVVAVVSQNLPADNIDQLKQIQAGRLSPLRVASEYVNVADKYLRDNHVSRYKLIPTWGASEAFLPEDADLLIENTQTGKTLAKHNLKIMDTIFQSTACLIGNKNSLESLLKGKKMASLVQIFRQAARTN